MALSHTDSLGNAWSFNDAGALSTARGGYMSDGYKYDTRNTLDSTSLALRVSGERYDTYLTLSSYSSTSNTHTATLVNTSAGVSITRKAFVGDGYVRMLEIVTNTGSSTKAAALSLGKNISYGSNTQIVATSSGDTAVTTVDDWASFGSGYNALYPKLTHVVSGGDGSPDAVTQSYDDQVGSTFNLNLAAGETKAVLHFYALSSDTTAATSIGNSLANLTDPAYLSGLTSADLAGLGVEQK